MRDIGKRRKIELVVYIVGAYVYSRDCLLFVATTCKQSKGPAIVGQYLPA